MLLKKFKCFESVAVFSQISMLQFAEMAKKMGVYQTTNTHGAIGALW